LQTAWLVKSINTDDICFLEERAAGYPFNLNFNTNGNLNLNGNNDKSNTNRQVRAVLAYGIVTL